MIKEGWLCDVRVVSAQTSINLDNLPLDKVGADYQLHKLSKRVNISSRNLAVVNTWKSFNGSVKSTLVFAVDIAHVAALCEQFRNAGYNSEQITSRTPSTVRRQLIDKFRDGKFPVLVNCGILSEGTDVRCHGFRKANFKHTDTSR